jgi:hypothetical protein
MSSFSGGVGSSWYVKRTIGVSRTVKDNTLIDVKTLDLGDEPYATGWPAKYVSEDTNINARLPQRIWNKTIKFLRPISVYEVTLVVVMKSASIRQEWDAVEELYSLCAFTFLSGKLVAISGLANVLASGQLNTLDTDDPQASGNHRWLHICLWTTEEIESALCSKNKLQVPRRY